MRASRLSASERGTLCAAPDVRDRAPVIRRAAITVFIVENDSLAHDALLAVLGSHRAQLGMVDSRGAHWKVLGGIGSHARRLHKTAVASDVHDHVGARLPEHQQLTGREMDVIDLIGAGMSTKEIAARLNITRHTVKSHVRSVMVKLALHTRLQIASYSHRERAAQHGPVLSG